MWQTVGEGCITSLYMPLGFSNLAAPYLQHERLKIFVGTSILEDSTRIFKDAKKYMWIHIETHIYKT
jgi:hypothetical protein